LCFPSFQKLSPCKFSLPLLNMVGYSLI
jgi:hypothetical protein